MDYNTTLTLAIILLVIIFIAVLWMSGRKKEARMAVYKLVLKAESVFIDEKGRGHEKYTLVMSQIYNYFPPLLKIFISEEEIDNWIEEAVKLLKSVTEE